MGKNITLTSSNPDSSSIVANTIINGGGTDRTVTFTGTETQHCTLTGFTMTGGSGSAGAGLGGWLPAVLVIAFPVPACLAASL